MIQPPTPFGQPCIPPRLPLERLDWARLVSPLGKANRAVAHYDGVLRTVPNPAVLLSPLTANEAVLSSKIEGTQATLQEVLEFESGEETLEPERRADIYEVLNYRKALHAAREFLRERPLHLGTLLRAHDILLDSVRGHNKARGQFRTVQNWIGRHGTNIGQARFIPPSPLDLPEALTHFENYLHFEEQDPIAQLGIVHAQFEILHPFLDGNGRVGRMLIPLFLYEKKVLASPMFYLSAYLEAHRQEYCNRLLAITEEGDWEGWLLFFLEAVRAQAEANASQANDILALYDRLSKEIPDLTHSRFSTATLDSLFNAPVFRQTTFIRKAKIPKASGSRILGILVEKGLLQVIRPGAGRRSAVLSFPQLLEIVNREQFKRAS
jgi:Fic family protein